MKCTDRYGNLQNCKVGDLVECDLAIFTVGKIHDNGTIPWLVSMDRTKPYTIKNNDDPMAVCVKSGNFAVVASELRRVV